MLFNTYKFIFLFLPIVLIGFFWLARSSHKLAAMWLVLASVFFYGWWNPIYVGLLLISIIGNYLFGIWISNTHLADKKKVLVVAISANLLLLGYYKYSNFFLGSVNSLVGTQFSLKEIILPLGISFFTFTQIAFLVDVFRGIVREYSFIHYLLFVTYFPHLIAGPVLHHKQMMPQFAQKETYHFQLNHFAFGTVMFTLGLAKKVLLADSLAEYATPVFNAAHAGVNITFFAAWIGAVAYSLQLYFDFSGYTDMAIGISKMINIDLPINFNSPYKSPNIIEFWRRWHMTLSQFLRDYLYIPLGGNRKGSMSRYVNLFITMLLGGLWHGANWTFVIWGGLHGAYLILNHFWRFLRGIPSQYVASKSTRAFTTLMTFISVVLAWVFFRANTASAAMNVIRGMLGLNGISMPVSLQSHASYVRILPFKIEFMGLAPGIFLPTAMIPLLFWFLISLFIIWGMPNSQQLQRKSVGNFSLGRSVLVATFYGLLFGCSILSFSRVSEFLYFQF